MSRRTKSVLVGLLAGAVLGGAFAWVVNDGEDDQETRMGLTALGPADYFTLGISILTLARQFSGMVKRA